MGVPGSGLHSNGYTLARRIIAESKYTYFDQMPDGKNTIGEEMLTPTRIYPEIVQLVKECDVHGLAHITGSGLLKLRRISALGFEITDPRSLSPSSHSCRSWAMWMRQRCTVHLTWAWVL